MLQPQTTQILVESNKHRKLIPAAMRSSRSRANGGVSKGAYDSLKRVTVRTGVVPQQSLYFHFNTNAQNSALGTNSKYIVIAGYKLCYSLGSNNTVVQENWYL